MGIENRSKRVEGIVQFEKFFATNPAGNEGNFCAKFGNDLWRGSEDYFPHTHRQTHKIDFYIQGSHN